MGLRFSTVLLENGVAIPCVERGDPAGPALLLLHGYSDSWRSFEPLLEWLPASLRAVANPARAWRREQAGGRLFA